MLFPVCCVIISLLLIWQRALHMCTTSMLLRLQLLRCLSLLPRPPILRRLFLSSAAAYEFGEGRRRTPRHSYTSPGTRYLRDGLRVRLSAECYHTRRWFLRVTLFHGSSLIIQPRPSSFDELPTPLVPFQVPFSILPANSMPCLL